MKQKLQNEIIKLISTLAIGHSHRGHHSHLLAEGKGKVRVDRDGEDLGLRGAWICLFLRLLWLLWFWLDPLGWGGTSALALQAILWT